MYHPRLKGNHDDMKDVFLVYDKSCFYKIVIAGICAGVDVLDHAGILCDVKSTHSSDADLVTDKNVITARANAYVDFAVEVAKKLNLFAGEADLQETINFWKHYQRVQ